MEHEGLPQAVNAYFPEQDANGIDLTLIRANLRLTPAQRMEKHDRALRFMLELRRSGRRAGLPPDLPGA